MTKRLIVIFFEIAMIVCSLPLSFAIQAGSLLWIILSAALLVGLLIGWAHFSRCPHCGRLIHCDYIKRDIVYCHYCGGKVDLNEGILHPKE